METGPARSDTSGMPIIEPGSPPAAGAPGRGRGNSETPSPHRRGRGNRGGQPGPAAQRAGGNTAQVTTRAAAQAGSRMGSIQEEQFLDSSRTAGTSASPPSLEARMDRVLSMLEEQKSAQAQFQATLARLERQQTEQTARLERQQTEQTQFQRQFTEFMEGHQQWRTSVDAQLAALGRADLEMQGKLELYSSVQDSHARLLDDCMHVTGDHDLTRRLLELEQHATNMRRDLRETQGQRALLQSRFQEDISKATQELRADMARERERAAAAFSSARQGGDAEMQSWQAAIRSELPDLQLQVTEMARAREHVPSSSARPPGTR